MCWVDTAFIRQSEDLLMNWLIQLLWTPWIMKTLSKNWIFRWKHGKYCPLVFKIVFQAVSSRLPCWKSVRPHPLISRASPVKTMLWSSTTSDTQPSVCPGVSSTVRNYRGKGTSPALRKCFNFFFLERNTINNMNDMMNLCFLHVSQKWSYRSPIGGYLQSLHWIWRWHSSAPPAFSSSTLCWWCGQHGSGCWLSHREKKLWQRNMAKKICIVIKTKKEKCLFIFIPVIITSGTQVISELCHFLTAVIYYCLQ